MPATHKYVHDKGFGEHHATKATRELPAEMRDLDMAPGTEVEHIATDEDTGALIVTWEDRTGITRNTAVQPDFFGTCFTAITPGTPEGI